MARLVLVHLNPKLADRLAGNRFDDFDSYVERHRHFGYYHWNQDATYRSQFDHKQVRFLRPFGVIDFVPDTNEASKRRNAEPAIDRNPQLELGPYGSPTFPTHASQQRHCVRISARSPPTGVPTCCSAAPCSTTSSIVLASLPHEPTIVSRLPPNDGVSIGEYRFSNVMVRSHGQEIRAGVASFATQGLPMPAYGSMGHERYDRQ